MRTMSIAPHLLFFSGLTIVMWGLWGFLGKLALERGMGPTLMFLAESATSAVLAIPVLLVLLNTHQDQSARSSLNAFGVLSGAALAVGLLFYYLALQRGQVSIVVPLTATYPVVSALLGVAVLGERPSLSQVFGIVLIIVGIVLLLYVPGRVSTT